MSRVGGVTVCFKNGDIVEVTDGCFFDSEIENMQQLIIRSKSSLHSPIIFAAPWNAVRYVMENNTSICKRSESNQGGEGISS